MPLVHHKSYGMSNSSEALAAEKLKDQFEKLHCEGSIFIASNVTLPGGNKVKDLDIVVAGYLKNFCIDDFEYSRAFSGSRADKRGLKVQSFLVVVELKEFSITQVAISDSGVLSARYASGDDKNITNQSFSQKFALRNVLNFYKKISPYTYNLIWLERIGKNEFENQFGQHDEWGILVGDFTAEDFLRAVAYNGERAIYQGDNYIINSFSRDNGCDEVMSVFDFFLMSKTSMGNQTRHKIEAISQREAQFTTTIIPGQITVLHGRAGTGKTIRLLQFAHQQVGLGKKCVFLTYNHALVSDIKRLIAFSDGVLSATDDLSIETMIQFFSNIMGQYGVDNSFVETNFEEVYEYRLKELKQRVESDKRTYEWDYILVDEAQDWSIAETELLMTLFRPEQIVIADGVDQFVRTVSNKSWDNAELNTIKLTKSLRQKSNLVVFVNAFADVVGIANWNIELNSNLSGGRVIVTSQLKKDLLDEIKIDCFDKQNAMYDILFLANSVIGNPRYMSQLLPRWREMGFPLFDGTCRDSREYYSIDVNEARIFNYNSCRGIEGWAVVCLDLDMLVEEKLRAISFTALRTGETDYDRQVRVWKEVCLWVLMPLTRAIDTLVITLRDTNSKIGKLFYELSKNHDFIEWRVD